MMISVKHLKKPNVYTKTRCPAALWRLYQEELERLDKKDGWLFGPPDPVKLEWMKRNAWGRLMEAIRLRRRCSSIPFYANRAKKRGESYWFEMTQSYRGEE